MQIHNSTDIIADIKQIIEQARKQAYTSINTLMIQSNWLVGRRIVEEEQGGASRAEYGKAFIFCPSLAGLSSILPLFQGYRDLALANAKSYLDSLS